MKIVQLLIDQLDEITGFEAVGLVNQPAHEGQFFAFNSDNLEDIILQKLIELIILEEFITVVPGECSNQYLKRCKEILSSEGYDEYQCDCICNAGVEIDTFQCEKQGKDCVCSMDSYFEDLSIDDQDRLLERLKSVGLKKDDYTIIPDNEKFNVAGITRGSANPEGWTNERIGNFKKLYQYVGPRDNKNRNFCRKLLDLDLLFRKEDIERLTLTGGNSEEFGYYNIFSYKGSFGCRHEWQEVLVEQKDNLGGLAVAGLLLDENTRRQFGKVSLAFSSDELQMVVGPLMIPDKLILRVDEDNNPYHVFFSKETIFEIARKMMKNKYLDKVNVEHNSENIVDGFMVETWIVNDPEKDKQVSYGFNYPEGTWMGMYKIEDPEVWKMVKSGKITGFSIEGFFVDKLIQD